MGRADESWTVLEGLEKVGGPIWFRIGDKDLSTHLERTRRLAAGELLSQITMEFCRDWGVLNPVIPMTDDVVETWVETLEWGWMPFQEYFVRHACEPKVKSFAFHGIDTASSAPEFWKRFIRRILSSSARQTHGFLSIRSCI